ncbi:YaeQ family protein [Photobacterium chitinilyticum]|uniref:YaeQ family protein n=1 Tax=Photobacterium chitinilyticum TaxID=2485123 RepID=A0A3S3UIG5_9GAMM|nr:YaeQ family protein [Photobacterium chitinilyticum]RWX54742.1 YaeQ family protein [Photobacterium chitinilyticum]
MAQKATIYKAQFNVADLDRHVYIDKSHTLACHPSETIQRLMLRLVAWGLNADEELQFTKGLSDTDEPDLWTKSLSDEIELWIELGLPEEKRIRKASHRSQQVIIFAYGDNAAPVWWQQSKSKITQYENVSVVYINDATLAELEGMIERTMQLQLTIEGEQGWLSSDSGSCHIVPDWWHRT